MKLSWRLKTTTEKKGGDKKGKRQVVCARNETESHGKDESKEKEQS